MTKRRLLPKYVSEFRDRHGAIRVRFRRTGYATYYFKSVPYSDAFNAEYQACMSHTAAPKIEPGADGIVRGSFNDLIARYYRTPEFLSPSPATQKNYRGVLERFRAAHGHRMVNELTYDKVTILLGQKVETPTAANMLRKVLRRLLRYSVQIKMRLDNPLDATKPYKITSTGYHTWTVAEVRKFEAFHAVGTKPRLAMELLLRTAQRRSDAVRMGRQHVAQNKIAVTQQKSGTKLSLPMQQELVEAIAAMSAESATFLTTQYGKPYTPAGFGNWFREQCDLAGLPRCSAHGLRKAAMTNMAEAGFTHSEIKSWSGHKGDAEVAVYIRDANQSDIAAGAVGKLRAGKLANRNR